MFTNRLAVRLAQYKQRKGTQYPYRANLPSSGVARTSDTLVPAFVLNYTGADRERALTNDYRNVNYVRSAKGIVFTDSVDSIGALVMDCDSYSRRYSRDSNIGWYADSFQDALIKYGVARLRTSRYTLYIAVTWNTDSDGACYHFDSYERVPRGSDEDAHTEAVNEVMRYADRCAEIEAEEEREYDAKSLAESRIEDAQSTIADNRESLRSLLKERREVRADTSAYPAICAAITNDARRLIREIREAKREIEKLTDNFWYAVEGF